MARALRRLLLATVIGLAVWLLAPTVPAQAAGNDRVLITGDSIAQGSAGDYTWRYRLWAKLTRTAPGSVSFVGTRSDLYDVVNKRPGSRSYAAGFPATAHAADWGDSYQAALGKIAAAVRTTKPDVLVAMLGSNDLTYLTSPAATIANVRTYINRARAARPGLDVVVGQVLTKYDPWSKRYQLQPQADDYARRLQTLARELSTAAERVTVAATGHGWDPADHTWDGTHPNPTGEALIAQRVSEALARVGVGSTGPDVSGKQSWSIAGPAAGLKPGAEQVALSWNRTSSGATGMYVEQRLVNTREAWRRMPYAVAGNGWTSKMLTAGGKYEFRLVPVKGSNVGVAGPVKRAAVRGSKPGPIKAVKAVASGNSLYGGKVARTSWSRSANASAYLVAKQVMSNGKLVWNELPYPVTKPAWNFEGLDRGRRYQFRVRGTHGSLRSPWKASAVTRMKGWPADVVQVSMGDSYSSGLGSEEKYVDKECLRSKGAWAFDLLPVGRAGMSLQACAGDRVPGVRKQMAGMNRFFAERRGRAQLITLTIGGNDVGFVPALAKCVTGLCVKKESSLNAKIDDVESTLRALYKDIRRVQPYADIIVGGYPAIVEPNGKSKNLLCRGIGRDEREMIERLSSRLNIRIASAARASGVGSVEQRVRDEFRGHGACAGGKSEWIHAGNLDIGGEYGVIDKKSFHPKDGGQVAYRRVFEAALAQVTK